MNSDISDAKQKLPLPALMHRLGLGERARKSARCPFHDDTHNSFSVWRNGSGRWFWKCHAGCGEGDEITFLEKHEGISNSEATKRYLEMAGVNSTTPSALGLRSTSTVDWPACVAALTDRPIQQLAKWRGYSIDFCLWLKQSGLVGLYNGCIAFPVHDRAGNVVAAHYRLENGSWRYHPQGVNVRPLVIGELLLGEVVHIFESQWDAFAFMDRSGERSGIIITRGASNGALIASLIPESCLCYLWRQNDPAGTKWQACICANIKAAAKRAKTPPRHKDLNDWTQAGATTDDLLAALMNAEPLCGAASPRSESSTRLEISQPHPFPLHCLSPVCEAMARAICETMRVLESLAGCCMLGILSAAIGRGLQVKSGPNRVTRANVYILASAESGSGKSEAFRHAAKPLFDFEAEQVTAWKAEAKPGLLAERKVLEAEIAKLTKSAGNANGGA